MDSAYVITHEQHLFFEENGYLIITDAVSEQEIKDHKVWAQAAHVLPRVKEACEYLQYDEINKKGERVLCRVENFTTAVPGFGSLLRGIKLVSIVSQLANGQMVLFKDKLNYKFAGSGGFAAHVDRAGYGAFRNLKHLSIAIAIDPANQKNGGMEVVSGSHKMEISISADKTLEKSWVKSQEWIPVNLEAGDILIFGTSFAHRSGPNNSTDDRRVLYATYNRAVDGDNHDAYYLERAKRYPSTHHRVPGVDYINGSKDYAYGTPMLTIERLVEPTVTKEKDGEKASSD
ncbi:uncharacterized protein EAF01_010974 [Botrytis porri]|uniref:Fe2OG dioxygenase domain-containing protein n=1 Tax=Botrytis porri TaxID=87229 RepID=A0A4Z1KBM0_9HELO|nr:uncharacterized protein EAF01_010974 [Botrytis porri]KAF7887820.1 hypothetical protein EAF01_010974 [Botrytis porri]TGO83593.1 hypothetical protein BPOR_0622g00010 [Botrytis porri]